MFISVRLMGFTEFQRLIADDTNLNADDHFGASVAVSGTTIVVGAPEYDGSGTDSGRAYVFEFNGTSVEPGWWWINRRRRWG